MFVLKLNKKGLCKYNSNQGQASTPLGAYDVKLYTGVENYWHANARGPQLRATSDE